ncbi:2-oxo acid dehydrogenase subunit E2 [Altererythrobacter luteolus]|uniref:Dihydrolipoamide acetyltransferase component of pyruvate dehydrogenase complex n=1 Tax=Pontixanthobacter luteolus TaxID=295089 RepID=A0A6I4V3I7_9SPHN|nr:dihydrolipoamide acetyltransferase family protein [Pontixanthobacter luteolus]MXP48275.1 2-oxo acid dehydrogenase subunit E2 [Pontixanthobacter luteolus]
MGTFTMPSLGADMEAGILVEWLKQPGEELSHGDIIAVVETDKGAIEVEVFEDGRLDRLLVEPGTKVPVGTPLAEIAGSGTQAQASPPPEPHVPADAPVETAPPAPPVSARPEAEPVSSIAPIFGAGERISPAARKLAYDKELDLNALQGTGPDGAIILADVQKAAGLAAGGANRTRPRNLAPMRRAIAAAMSRSKREIPHYYLCHSFDVSAAREWLDAFNGGKPPAERLVFSALTLKAVALAVSEFPEFNGFYGQNGFSASRSIHVGIAIALRGGGLAAPAIHNTDRLSLPELMLAMNDLVSRTRAGGFRSSEISDPTVTVSSLGERGVEALLPIIYPPQVAIIGFGSVVQRAWATGGAVQVRPVMCATLAADHRASDGHRGALLLRRIEELLSHPEGL